MSGGILFLAHRLPFPPDRGDKIRSHHVLNALAELAPVHVGCFAESEADFAHRGDLELIAASHCLPLRSKPVPLAGTQALVQRVPVSCAAFNHPELAKWVERTLSEQDISTIYVFSGQMGQYVPADWHGKLVIDLVDVDSAKFEAYAADAAGPMAWINAREGRLLRRMEADLAAQADHILLVSEAEAKLLRGRIAEADRPCISALRNGIDTADFDPAKVAPHPALAEHGPHFVFTGQMDYAPNIAAACRMARVIMPAILAEHPRAMFHIVGREPSRAVQELANLPGCRVWGAVPDVRPFVKAADLIVAPLTIARGVQNKVLEAMAMARPVLLTPQAATGIDARDTEHFAVAASDADLIRRALALLADPAAAQTMGAAARKLVAEQMSWPAMLAELPSLMGVRDGDGGSRHAA